jgi:hypothetical protein
MTDKEYIELGKKVEEYTQGLTTEDIHPEMVISVIHVLARMLCESNAKHAKFDLKGFSVKGKDYGDVKIKVTRLK